MEKLYKAAIIGCGNIAGGYQVNSKDDSVWTHAKAYRTHRNTKIVAAVDIDRQKLNKFCKKWEISKAYTDVQTMLREERPDIVSICTPAEAHQDILELCIDFNDVKAFWCEKPLGEDYNFVKSLFKNKDRILYVNHLRRWDKAIEKLKYLIDNKVLGELLLFKCSSSKDFFETGSHVIDLIYYLLGKPTNIKILNVVEGIKGGKNNAFFPDIYMEFENSLKAYILFSKAAFNFFDLDLLFTKGRIKSFDNAISFKLYPVVQSRRFYGHYWLSLKGKDIDSDLDRSMLKILDSIVRSLNSGALLQNDLEFELKSFGLFCDVHNKTKEFLRCQN